MKRTLLFCFGLISLYNLHSQPTVLGTQLVNGGYSTYDLSLRGAVRFVRLQATSSAASGARNWEFASGTAASTNYNTNWRPYTNGNILAGYNQIIDPANNAASARYNTGSGGQSGLLPAITNANFYTILVGINSTANNFMSVLETSYNPKTFSRTQSPSGTVYNSQPVNINITLNNALSSGEKVFVRWHAGGEFAGATFTEATNFGGGTTGSVTIPGQGSGTSVSYYVLSTTQASPSNTDIDYYTLNLDNNNNSNYSYTVSSSYASIANGNWSNSATWAAGNIPPANSNVVIDNNVTLDQNATVSSLTINSAKTFTASDATPRILTINALASTTTLINNGTFTPGLGTIYFTGTTASTDFAHAISGIVPFYNVTIGKAGGSGSGNLGVNFGLPASTATRTIAGTLQIDNGGFVLDSPTDLYKTNSTLIFNSPGGYTIGIGDKTWPSVNSPSNIFITQGAVILNRDRTASGNLIINGGDFSIGDGITLSILGNWLRSSGTFTSNQSTVKLIGTTPQSIQGLNGVNLYNLTLTNTTGAVQNSSLTVTNALALTSGSLSIGANTLTLAGTLSGSSFLKGSLSSNLVISGFGALGTINMDQTADGSSNVLNNFTLNRTSSGTAVLGNKLVITNTYTPTTGILTTGGNLTLRSDASNTARITQGSASGGYIAGEVTAERYIASSGNRAYRQLAPIVNTVGGTQPTIRENWQGG